MYTIKLKRSNHSMSVRHVVRNVSLKHVGRQGLPGPPGDPASNLVTSVNGRIGAVTGLAETSELATVAFTGSYNDLNDTPDIPDVPVLSVNGKTGEVVLDKTDIGLDQVDNTSDADKQISNPTQVALDLKEDKANRGIANGYAPLNGSLKVPGAYLPSSDGITEGITNRYYTAAREAYALDRANHTGVQAISSVTGLQSALDGKEGSITAGTTLQYWRGDKTWQTLNTSVVPESGNLYYTDVRVDARIAADATHVLKAGDTMTGTLTSTASVVGFQQTRGGITRSFGSNASGDFVMYNVTSSLYTGIMNGSGLAIYSGSSPITPTHSLTLPSVATGIAAYNTVDQSINYERARMFWSGGTYNIVTEQGGTGLFRSLTIQSAANLNLVSGGSSVAIVNSSTTAKILNTSASTGVAGIYGALNTSIFTGSSGIQYALGVTSTISQTSTGGYTLIHGNATENTTGSGVKLLLDLQVGGVSKVKIDNSGYLTTPRLYVNSTAYIDGATAGRHIVTGILDIGGYGTPLLVASPPMLIKADVAGISGVEMTNVSAATNADFRFLIKDSTGHYLAFAQPGTGNTEVLFGYTRSTIDTIFTNGGTGRTLVIGTLTANDLVLGTQGSRRVTISGSLGGGLVLVDGFNLVFDTTTGSKIGTSTTQKVGFWNATPIVQPTTAVAAATRVGGGGTTVTDTDTFDGYTIAKVVKALRNAGLLA